MGMRFQRRIKIAKGLHLNVSKSGVGIGVSAGGLSVSAGPRGIRTSASLRGTGLSDVKQRSWNSKPKGQKPELSVYSEREVRTALVQRLEKAPAYYQWVLYGTVISVLFPPALLLTIPILIATRRTQRARSSHLVRKASRRFITQRDEQAFAILEESIAIDPTNRNSYKLMALLSDEVLSLIHISEPTRPY